MTRIDILCVGRIREAFYREAAEEYLKRLKAYATVRLIEVKDEKTPEGAGDKENAKILQTEGERLSAYLEKDAYVFVLAIEGKQPDSAAFSAQIAKLELDGKSHLQFVIGGSLGLSEEIKKQANHLLSFSKLTYPHPLMRVILLEQIYRAYKIQRGEPYHK